MKLLKGCNIPAQGKRGTSATLGTPARRGTLPLPIGWGEGLISAFVLCTPLLPYSHARASANDRLATPLKTRSARYIVRHRRYGKASFTFFWCLVTIAMAAFLYMDSYGPANSLVLSGTLSARRVDKFYRLTPEKVQDDVILAAWKKLIQGSVLEREIEI